MWHVTPNICIVFLMYEYITNLKRESGGLKNWNMDKWFSFIPQTTDVDGGKNAWRKSDCDSWPSYINISYVSAWANECSDNL